MGVKKRRPYDLKKLGLDTKKMPRHVAIIMDGNGRWAKQRGLPREEGHRRGARAVRSAVECARRLGIKYLTLYAFSKDNWRRPKEEINALMQLLKRYLLKEREELKRNDIKFNVVGDIDNLPEDVREEIEKTVTFTRGCRGMMLTLALSYSGRREMIKCIKNAVEKVLTKEIKLGDVDEGFLSKLMGLPDVDLLIRTSGEIRVSDFLLWQISYAELYFTETLWPDFGSRDFIKALKEYQRRERRFGRLAPA